MRLFLIKTRVSCRKREEMWSRFHLTNPSRTKPTRLTRHRRPRRTPTCRISRRALLIAQWIRSHQHPSWHRRRRRPAASRKSRVAAAPRRAPRRAPTHQFPIRVDRVRRRTLSRPVVAVPREHHRRRHRKTRRRTKTASTVRVAAKV